METVLRERHIDTCEITWSGIIVKVTFERNWLNSTAFATAHLQLESISPARAPLPVTETGYRSHFTPAEAIDSAGGPVAFVLAWLEQEAKASAWSKTRQLDLFA